MSAVVIFNYQDHRVQLENYRSQMDEIFFESSTRKVFSTPTEKEEFNWKYLGFYLAHYPEFTWLAVKEGRVLGYLSGMPFSRDPSLYQIQSHLKAFEEYFNHYPAHLHINCHVDSRGQGLGQLLVAQCLKQMRAEGASGLHIMTSPEASNRAFYHKLGFDYEVVLNSILFMGIKLN